MLCFVDPFFICGIRTTASIPAFQAGDAGSTPVYRSKNEPIRKINSATRCLSPIRKPLSMPGEVSGRINGRGSKARKTRSSLGISGSRSLNQRRARHRKCKVYIPTSESLRSLLCRYGRVVDGSGLENRRVGSSPPCVRITLPAPDYGAEIKSYLCMVFAAPHRGFLSPLWVPVRTAMRQATCLVGSIGRASVL